MLKCLSMRLVTHPFGPSLEVHPTSDVESLSYSSKGMVVRVACEVSAEGQIRGLDVSFNDATAFRYLNEVDLARYWRSEGFVRGYPVLEVLEGGWSDEEAALQGYEQRRREWLVVTGNSCVSVLAATHPSLEEAEWHLE